MIHSMTGFSTKTLTVLGEPYKIEIKSLNHRYLDLKLRMPKAFYGFESQIKALIESKVKRGSVDVWIEKVGGLKNDSTFRVNETAAQVAFSALTDLRHRFQISEGVSLRDIISFPEVIEKSSGSEGLTAENEQAAGRELMAALSEAVHDLLVMRAQEGLKLRDALLHIITDFRKIYGFFLNARTQIQTRARDKIKKRIEQCFEAYETSDERLRALMETRIAQEITYTLEKLDIEEELTRFKGHIDQIERLLLEGMQVGKKLDFMFQELNREVNTLGNKAQDLGVSQEVIELKMRIEQMREQSLNLE